jgi:hypothetical protein
MAKRKKGKKSDTSGRLLYWLSHIVCALVVLFIVLTTIQCTVKKPEAPTWRSDLVVPLVNKTWDMGEIIDRIDQENLRTDSAGNPSFFFHSVLDTIAVAGAFTVQDASRAIAESLGVVQLDPIGGAAVSVSLADYVTLEAGMVPPVSFDIIDPLPPMGDYATITIETGFAVINVENNFGLDLDTVVVTLVDATLGGDVTVYDIPDGVPAGTTAVDTVVLDGVTVSNQLRLQIHCHTPGATSFSLSGKSLEAGISMPEGPYVSSATAEIPRITKSFNEQIAIAADHVLETAELDGGQLILDIQNNTNVRANLTIILPDLTSGGEPLIIYQPVNANTSQVFNYDLTGYVLAPQDQTVPQAVPVEVLAVIDSTAPQQVTFDAGDRISVTASLDGISLASVQGIIAPTTADFDGVQQAIDVPKGFEGIQLPSAVLTFEIENTVNIPGSFSIDITGDQGQQKTIAGVVAPGTPTTPVTTVIIDSNLSSFTNPMPELLTVSGGAVFGDGVTSGSITSRDYITATVTISSPLDMIIDSTAVIGEWESTTIDRDEITKITDNLNLARMVTTITNNLPVGVTVEILLGGDSATLYANPELTLGPIVVNAATLAPDGTVASPCNNENIITLDSIQAQVLNHDPLWIGENILLHGTNGSLVRFTAGNSVTISGYMEVDLDFSDILWEDK